MSFQAASITGQCDIDEILVIAKILERRCYATLIVVPSQTEVLSVHHFAGVVVVIVFLEEKNRRKEFDIIRGVLSYITHHGDAIVLFYWNIKLLTIWNVCCCANVLVSRRIFRIFITTLNANSQTPQWLGQQVNFPVQSSGRFILIF